VSVAATHRVTEIPSTASERPITEKKAMSTAEALYRLKRRLPRVVFHYLTADRTATAPCLAAAA